MAHPTLRERDISIDGVRSHVLEGGPDGPDAVVFVHGNPGSSRDWRPLATAVSAVARVFVPDMPGFGRADKPAVGFEYTVAGYARHLGRLLDAVGIRRAHLVLHDFGGPWGLTWAAGHPDGFRSVVLIDTGVLPGYVWHIFAQIWMTPALGEALQLATNRLLFFSLIKLGNPQLPDDFVDAMYDDYDEGTRRAVLSLYRATPDVGAVTVALSERLQPLQRPALVIWGRHDPYIDATYATRQAGTFAVKDVVVLAGGHWPFAEDPQAVLNEMIPFLRARIGGG